jgi:hypothetical protein
MTADNRILACRLWQKTSANDNLYMIGRMGGARVLIFANKDRASGDDATHSMFLAPADDGGARVASAPKSAAAAPAAPQRRRKPTVPPRAGAAPLDDPMPENMR